MKYLEFSFRLDEQTPQDTPSWLKDLLIYQLGEIGFDSFSESDDAILAYIQTSLYQPEALREVITSEILCEHMISFAHREAEDKDWNEEWEKNYFQPVVIENLRIRASFHEPDPSVAMEIIIDPKMAFGTGNHGTTSSMIKLIQRSNPKDKTVIDMGCGSGILGIYAMKLGAKECIAIDYDEWSVTNTQENARLNSVTLDIRHGDASVLSECPIADLFIANINRNIIIADLPHYLSRLHEEGTILLSGFYEEDLSLIRSALAEQGLSINEVIEQEKWVAVSASRARQQ